MRVPASWGMCLAVSLLAHTFGLGALATALLATAQAQTVPKSLEEGGTDAAHEGQEEQLDGRRRRRTAVGHLHDLRQRAGAGSRRRRQSARRSDRHLWRRIEPGRSALSAAGRRRGDPGGRVRIFPHPAENLQPRIPGQLHRSPAGLGDARPRAHRHQEDRGSAGQEGQLRAGRKRFEPDRHDRLSAAGRPGRAGAVRQSDRAAKAQVGRDRRAGARDRQADRLLCQDPGEFGPALRADPVFQDFRRLLRARRTHQQGISDAGSGRPVGRHHCGSGGARGVQLAEGQRPLPARRKVHREPVHQVGQVSRAAAPSEMARRQSCGDRSRLDPLERRGRDAASAFAPKESRTAGGQRRVFGLPEEQGSGGREPYAGAA